MPLDHAAIDALVTAHTPRLQRAFEAIRTRDHWTPFPESPSRKLHPPGAAERGKADFGALLGKPLLLSQHHESLVQPPEASPFTGQPLGIAYEWTPVQVATEAAGRAMGPWQALSPPRRVAVCMEMLDRLSQQCFLNAHATMHTAGQAFMMAFAGSGANALDRGLEALAMAALAMETFPGTSTFVRRFGRGEPVTLDKRTHIVGRGTAAVFACATYPAWNAHPAVFANLAVGNPVLLKPHPSAVLPMAIAVRTLRDALGEVGLPGDVVQLVLDPPDRLVGLDLVEHPDVAIVDFTGSQRFGTEIERRHRHAYTETSGCNPVVLESTMDLDATLKAVAQSLCIFSAQMCTAAQNIFVPASGVITPQGCVPFDEVERRLVSAIDAWVEDASLAALICGAVQAESTLELLDRLAQEAPASAVVRRHRPYAHPDYPDARTTTPLLLRLDPDASALHRQEHFGPVGFLLPVADRDAAVAHATADAAACGCISAYLYSTDDAFIDHAERAFWGAGTSVGVNLHRQAPINYAAAFSDVHVTGLNPAGTASLTDLAFVADRFRIVQSKRERWPLTPPPASTHAV